jgi:hypothetical protein
MLEEGHVAIGEGPQQEGRGKALMLVQVGCEPRRIPGQAGLVDQVDRRPLDGQADLPGGLRTLVGRPAVQNSADNGLLTLLRTSAFDGCSNLTRASTNVASGLVEIQRPPPANRSSRRSEYTGDEIRKCCLMV